MGVQRRRAEDADLGQSGPVASRRAVPALLALQSLAGNRAVTGVVQRAVTPGKFNVVGEDHGQTGERGTSLEETYLSERFGIRRYWGEGRFSYGGMRGDDRSLRARHIVYFIHNRMSYVLQEARDVQRLSGDAGNAARLKDIFLYLNECDGHGRHLARTLRRLHGAFVSRCRGLPRKIARINQIMRADTRTGPDLESRLLSVIARAPEVVRQAEAALRDTRAVRSILDDDDGRTTQQRWDAVCDWFTEQRSAHMFVAASAAADAGVTGVWKVGEKHIPEIGGFVARVGAAASPGLELTSLDEFNQGFEPWRKARDKAARRARTLGRDEHPGSQG